MNTTPLEAEAEAGADATVTTIAARRQAAAAAAATTIAEDPSRPSAANDDADHVQERVECPIENRGIVIGKNGKQVQRIERDTGAKVSSQGDEPFSSFAAPRRAFATPGSQIASTILDAADMPPLPPPPPEGAQHALEVHVERDHIGKVMGYGAA